MLFALGALVCTACLLSVFFAAADSIISCPCWAGIVLLLVLNCCLPPFVFVLSSWRCDYKLPILSWHRLVLRVNMMLPALFASGALSSCTYCLPHSGFYFSSCLYDYKLRYTESAHAELMTFCSLFWIELFVSGAISHRRSPFGFIFVEPAIQISKQCYTESVHVELISFCFCFEWHIACADRTLDARLYPLLYCLPPFGFYFELLIKLQSSLWPVLDNVNCTIRDTV